MILPPILHHLFNPIRFGLEAPDLAGKLTDTLMGALIVLPLLFLIVLPLLVGDGDKSSFHAGHSYTCCTDQ